MNVKLKLLEEQKLVKKRYNFDISFFSIYFLLRRKRKKEKYDILHSDFLKKYFTPFHMYRENLSLKLKV